jgi:YYY domain-containing protein
MPFVLLVVGLALNVFVRRRGQSDASQQSFAWLGSLEFWLTAVALGSLSFLNTWDFPIYLALFAAAVALAQLLRAGWSWQVVIDFFEALVFLGVAGVILYLPFYLGFSSQANGVLPSLIFFTRGIYFWVMFGSLLLPIFLWLVWKWRGGSTRALLQGLLFGVGLVGALWLVSSVYGMLKLGSDPNLAGIYGAAPGAPLVQESLARRFAAPGTWISLVVLLALVWGLLQTWLKRPENNASADTDASLTTNHRLWDSSDAFVLLLILLGAGLAIFPEFFYLRDQFGWRMNTIFKFYFQTWVVWAIAAGYASVVLWEALRKPLAATAYRTAWAALVAAALVYPAYGIWDRSTHFANPAGWTLDGDAYIQNYEPLELDAMRYLQTLPVGTIVEAVGGSYTGYARVSTHTGYPSVLGWPGHESQWRGGAKEMGSREADIAQLYRAKTWEQISQILAKYQIRYVYVGSLEQSTYHTLLTVFDRYLNPVYHNSGVTIYEVPNEPLGQAGQP